MTRRRSFWFPCEGLVLAFIFALMAFILAVGSGCTPMVRGQGGESAFAGGANYTMNCGPDGTSEIQVGSSREVHSAAIVVNGRDCTLEVVIEDLNAVTVSSDFLLDLMGRQGR